MEQQRPNLAVPNLSVALIHWPCWNQKREVVCTNVTNLDIHDIARASRSFGVKDYYIINKAKEQLMFVHRVLDHWRIGDGHEHNYMRRTAIENIKTAETFEESLRNFEKKPIVVATSAKDEIAKPRITHTALREKIWLEPNQPVYVLFGTGWGLHDDILDQCDLILEPIKGSSADDYRHLSVRSAVSITLDRLLGQW